MHMRGRRLIEHDIDMDKGQRQRRIHTRTHGRTHRRTTYGRGPNTMVAMVMPHDGDTNNGDDDNGSRPPHVDDDGAEDDEQYHDDGVDDELYHKIGAKTRPALGHEAANKQTSPHSGV